MQRLITLIILACYAVMAVSAHCNYCVNDDFISYYVSQTKKLTIDDTSFSSHHTVYTLPPLFSISSLGICVLTYHANSFWVDKASTFPSMNLSLALNSKWVIQSQYAHHFATSADLPPTNLDMLLNQQKNNFLLGMVYRFG